MSQNDGDLFRQRLEEARAESLAEAFPMEFAGFPCRVRPLGKLEFIRAGRVPEHLTQKIIAANDGGGEASTPAPKPSAADIIKGETFYRRAVCAVLVEPRVVEAEPVPEGGYLFADLEESAPRFAAAVYAWIMADCPRPASEKGGEVAGVEDLENFPDGAGGRAGVDVGDTGEGVGSATVGADAADRE